MPEELRFDGRVVVVTGAGAGLGRAYALLFASRGASVVVNDLGGGRHGDGSGTRSADSVVDEIRRTGGRAVANYDSVLNGGNIIKTAIDAFGRVDVLVNNAGILRDVSFGKMSEAEWDAIYDVHVRGAVKTTKAAWPYFTKQKYGRIILTSSNSGLYGNFGQANYSSAKMGLVGLANTLAIEGANKNIHTNVIVPTAGSRLTEDIMPPDFFRELKPELIAPVVFWLCHENCRENGSIVESALGWAGKCHIVRSSGQILRRNLKEIVTPENVEDNWANITDMNSAKRVETIQDATMQLLDVLQTLETGESSSAKYIVRSTYNHRDAILYALGVGASLENPHDMRYLYENHENFAVLPTFYILYGPLGVMSTDLLQSSSLPIDLDPTRFLHGEQYFEASKPLPTQGTVETRLTLQDALDKDKGAVFLIQHDTYDVGSGEKLSSGQISAFLVGAGGFGGPRTSKHAIPTLPSPDRQPDATATQRTSPDQAALYRLSGDPNPLHIDENIAGMAGFQKPILHGLCSLGYSVRHILERYAGGDPSLFKAVKARFAKPTIPGQTLRTEMWYNGSGNRIHFRTIVVENNTTVISGAYVDLLSIKESDSSPTTMRRNGCSANSQRPETDAVFDAIKEFVKSQPDQAKKIDGVFLYNINQNGAPATQWTLDLKRAEVYRGKPKSGKADATLTVEDKDMVDIAIGKLNPQVAFMRGKLKITGNIMLTQKLKGLMEINKAKL